MFGLDISDIVVILLYFGVIIYIGIRSSLKIKKQEDYFLGGRKFGKLISTFASFGQATSADGPAGVATTTFNNGASGIWSSLLMLFVTPLFWITSPWLRRLRVITMGDFYLERYGSKNLAATYALVASIGMMGLLSVGYLAVTKTAMAMTPKEDHMLVEAQLTEKKLARELFMLESKDGRYLTTHEKQRLGELRQINPRNLFSHTNEKALIWGICFLVLIYTSLGGLEAAFYTDLLQGVFIILLSVILIPFSWHQINAIYGGSGMMQALGHMHAKLPESFFEIFGSPMVIDFTWYFILAAALVSGTTVVTQPNQLVTAGAAKDEYAARVGFVTGTFMKRVVTIMWGAVGLAAILLFGDSLTNSDFVWGHATKSLLGPVKLGLVGLMLASMMAALMSTADCLMITVSGLVVRNLYQPLFGLKSERHYIWVGRIAGGIFLIGAALITTQFDNILQVLKFIWEFFVIFAAAFWLGLKWRRANLYGAWASILGAFSLFYLIPVLLPIMFPGLRTSERLLKRVKPAPVERVYTAKSIDIQKRNAEILAWQSMDPTQQKAIEKPVPIEEGEKITRQFLLPQKSIFWSKDIKTDASKQPYGSGYIYLELLLLDALGIDLSKNPYAFNETLRLLIRLVFPFVLLIMVTVATSSKTLVAPNRFFIKMRTPVDSRGGKADESILEKRYENPETSQDMLIFKNSNLEFYKWKRKDWYGFLLSWSIVLVILALLYAVVSLGK
ncbi:sodium:solute symporter family protein [Fulvivirgaceae bacterium BMA12]|uniref:Sodium:solute symporter family protein n=1 Tax=Agaribacillus aureus TaxID=3051825 RepID=A0ABT8LHV7_9BACT|nr:sodium:solute symporter family protein [Fulvivirgaceae bacterium BMA12]